MIGRVLSNKYVGNLCEIGMRKKREYHHGNLKSGLINLASEEIEHGNIDTFSIRSLAKRLGVVHGAAYRHFSDKNELIAHAFAKHYRDISAAFGASIGSGQSINRLEEISQIYADFSFDKPHLFLAMAGPRLNMSGQYDFLEQAISEAFAEIKLAVAARKPRAKMSNDQVDSLSTYYWGALQGVLVQIIQQRIKLSKKKRNDYIAFVISRLVCSLDG